MTTSLEPKDKLGAASIEVVNGPEDEILDWHAVDWRACEETVRRLRQRIFTASRANCTPAAHRACLSRMHGNVPVRF